MSFDFKRAKEYAKKAMKSPLLELVILGSQGAGKSFTIGTLGVKTLYLYGTRENHGPKAAAVRGGENVDPICFDFGQWKGEKKDRPFTPDEAWSFLQTILNDHAWLKEEGYKAIALDGLAVLDELVKGTTAFREACKTASGKHNSFGESAAAQSLIGQIVSQLKACQRELGVHIVVTGVLDVKSVDGFGGIEEAAPRLSGYGLAESLNQHFSDITVVGKMTKGGEVKYKFQFLSDLTKASKDEMGNIKRAMNFNPRLSGCETPAYMDADLSKLMEYKREKMK